MYVVHMNDKINVIVCMVWSVVLELDVGEFKLCLKYKYVTFFSIFVISGKMKG